MECPGTTEDLTALIDRIAEIRAALTDLEKAEERSYASVEKQAEHVRDALIPAMDRVRASCDALERIVPDDLWPLPSYEEMLFLR